MPSENFHFCTEFYKFYNGKLTPKYMLYASLYYHHVSSADDVPFTVKIASGFTPLSCYCVNVTQQYITYPVETFWFCW